MTGLDPSTDVILSISCFITNAQLDLLDPHGLDIIIKQPKSVLDNMSEWCKETHTSSGLVSACLSTSPFSSSSSPSPWSPSGAVRPDQAASLLLEYIKTYIAKPRTGVLAGNSVHQDKAFLMAARDNNNNNNNNNHNNDDDDDDDDNDNDNDNNRDGGGSGRGSRQTYAKVLDYLHYRILDVSSFKEGARRWAGKELLERVPVKKGLHQARQDVLESLEECRFYREVFFLSGQRERVEGEEGGGERGNSDK